MHNFQINCKLSSKKGVLFYIPALMYEGVGFFTPSPTLIRTQDLHHYPLWPFTDHALVSRNAGHRTEEGAKWMKKWGRQRSLYFFKDNHIYFSWWTYIDTSLSSKECYNISLTASILISNTGKQVFIVTKMKNTINMLKGAFYLLFLAIWF